MSITTSDDLAVKYGLGTTQADELHRLLTDMARLGFTRSKQLSEYVVRHSLGYRYPEISGIVRMREGSYEWDFPGGFPPKVYAIVCSELGLDNEHTPARPVGFTSFKSAESAKEARDELDYNIPF